MRRTMLTVAPANGQQPAPSGGAVRLFFNPQTIEERMTKSVHLMNTPLTHSNRPFRQVDARPDKARKHRYERRKIRECLRSGDWSDDTGG